MKITNEAKVFIEKTLKEHDVSSIKVFVAGIG